MDTSAHLIFMFLILYSSSWYSLSPIKTIGEMIHLSVRCFQQ